MCIMELDDLIFLNWTMSTHEFAEHSLGLRELGTWEVRTTLVHEVGDRLVNVFLESFVKVGSFKSCVACSCSFLKLDSCPVLGDDSKCFSVRACILHRSSFKIIIVIDEVVGSLERIVCSLGFLRHIETG